MPKFIKFLQNRQEDESWSETRFKKIADEYKHFHFPEHLYDIVDIHEFRRIEENRLPLFVGSQFGLYPRIEKHFGEGKNGVLIGILCKSMLSGHVAGLKIAYYKDNEIKELVFIRT